MLWKLLCISLLLLGSLESVQAQLTWGVNGAGGSGTWNGTTSNWYTGTSNTTWVSTDTGTFAGTGGTVTIGAGGENATSLVFNSSGYTITGYTLNATSTFNVQVNAASAAISATLSLNGTFTKSGSGTLSLSYISVPSSSETTNITGGTLQLLSTNAVNQYETYNLSNTLGASLFLNAGANSTYTIAGLNGGGSTGGTVVVGSASGTSTIVLASLPLITDTYGGVLQDNGAGKLAVTVSGSDYQIFTGANTYTGATLISGSGNLTLAGTGGSLLNSAITVQGGDLRLDNTSGNNTNRLSDTAPILLNAGTIIFQGQNSGTSTETTGTIVLNYGFSTIESLNGSGGSAVLTLAGISRSFQGGSVEFFGPGSTQILSATNSNGIIGAYATMGYTDWAALDAQNNVVAYSAYATNANTAVSTDNVKLTATGTTTLSTNRVFNTLNIQNTSTSNLTFDLGGNSLELTDGGILIGGNSNAGFLSIQNGTLTSLNGELLITAQSVNVPSTLAINTNIIDSSIPVGLTKDGLGKLYLGGVNTYTGGTVIQAGGLIISSATALPSTTVVTVKSGALLEVQNGATIAGLTGDSGGNVVIDAGMLTINSAANGSYTGFMTGAGGLAKTGTGTFELSGALTYTGTTQVSQGMLLLHEGASSGQPVLASTSAVILAGGTLAFDTPSVGGVTQHLGTLTLTNASVLDMVNTLQFNLTFSDSSAISWGSNTLTIDNFSTSLDKIRFGTSATGLTGVQLSDIVLAGTGMAAGLDSNGYLIEVAAPEPSSIMLLLVGLSVVVYLGARKRRDS